MHQILKRLHLFSFFLHNVQSKAWSRFLTWWNFTPSTGLLSWSTHLPSNIGNDMFCLINNSPLQGSNNLCIGRPISHHRLALTRINCTNNAIALKRSYKIHGILSFTASSSRCELTSVSVDLLCNLLYICIAKSNWLHSQPALKAPSMGYCLTPYHRCIWRY